MKLATATPPLEAPAVPLTAADGLVVLEPGADPDGLTGAVAAAARAENIPVAELTGQPGLAPLLAQIPMTVRLQLLAGNFARLRHQDPDTAIVGAWNEPELWRMGSPAAR